MRPALAILLAVQQLIGPVRMVGPSLVPAKSATPTWSFIQEKRNEGCTGGTACAVTVAGIGAGNYVVAAMITGASLLLSSVGGDTNAFTTFAQCTTGTATYALSAVITRLQ